MEERELTRDQWNQIQQIVTGVTGDTRPVFFDTPPNCVIVLNAKTGKYKAEWADSLGIIEWVSVEDRLPELRTAPCGRPEAPRDFLCACGLDGLTILLGRFDGERWWKSDWVKPEERNVIPVTHWAELPAPPTISREGVNASRG